MKKIIYALLATLSGLVLMFSYRTSLEAVMPAVASTAAPSASSNASSGAGPSTNAGSTSSSNPPGLADGIFTGDAVSTRYGAVQVEITVSGGQIQSARALQYPDSNGQDRQINGRAIPILVSETAQTDSAQVDMVSGATYTSEGYVTSLQSALDQAQGR